MGRSRHRALRSLLKTLRRCGLVFTATLLLSACGATYTYKKISPDGSTCELIIDSDREIQLADLLLDSDCAIRGGAAGITNSKEIQESLRELNTLIRQLPL